MYSLEMKNRLVYHLYIPGYGIPEIYKYHFACLRYFAKVFDEYVFVISTDNTENTELLKAVELKLLSIVMYKNVTFNIIKNDSNIRETYTFKTEILDKLQSSNTLTFFAHAKGASNNLNESLIYWICSLYYFGLGDIDYMKYRLVGSVVRLFYGPFAYYGEYSLPIPKYHWMYPGSFYWINMKSLYNYSIDHEFPKIEGRCYAENFPGNITPLKDAGLHLQLGVSASDYFFDDGISSEVYDFYTRYENLLNCCFSEEKRKQFYKFVTYIKENLENI